jgi:hypothetical protein
LIIEIGKLLVEAKQIARRVWRTRLIVVAFAVVALVFVPCIARAQQTLELAPPAPQSQRNYPIRPAPTPRSPALPPSRQLQVLPQVPTPTPAPTPAPTPQPAPTPRPAPPPSSALEAQPKLPAIFRGCWQGRVNYLDWIKREYGAPGIGPWTPKTYRICYQRVGGRPFKLTFSQVGVVPNSKIVNPTGQMRLISTNGRNSARMVANLHFDEYYPGPFFRANTFPVDEETILNCTIEPNGAMMVWGSVFGRRQHVPWFRAGWRAVFERIRDLPE